MGQEKHEDFEEAYEDLFYLDAVKNDEEHLFDVSSLVVTAGVEVCVIEQGKVVEEQFNRF